MLVSVKLIINNEDNEEDRSEGSIISSSKCKHLKRFKCIRDENGSLCIDEDVDVDVCMCLNARLKSIDLIGKNDRCKYVRDDRGRGINDDDFDVDNDDASTSIVLT